MKVKLDQIKHNPYNTRQEYGDLSGLKTSIEKFGLTQPFLARKTDEGYEIAFGSRRYEALRQAGVTETDIEVKNIDNEDMVMLAICENVHRKDLTAGEQARAYERGLRVTKMSLEKFAESVGVSKVTVKDYLSILTLPQSVLNKSEKYGKSELIYLGKLNQLSSSIRIMLENVLENRDIGTKFLREVVNSCESVYASNLPLKTKRELCGDIIFHDYSSLAPENYRDIKSFSDALLEKAIIKYQEGLNKTEKARAKLGGQIPRAAVRRIKKIDDIVHADQKLDEVTYTLREAGSDIKKAIKNNYYPLASKRSKRKFKVVVNHIVSGIEEILKDEEFRR